MAICNASSAAFSGNDRDRTSSSARTIASSVVSSKVIAVRTGGLAPAPLEDHQRPPPEGQVATCIAHNPPETAPTIRACFADGPQSPRRGWAEMSSSLQRLSRRKRVGASAIPFILSRTAVCLCPSYQPALPQATAAGINKDVGHCFDPVSCSLWSCATAASHSGLASALAIRRGNPKCLLLQRYPPTLVARRYSCHACGSYPRSMSASRTK